MTRLVTLLNTLVIPGSYIDQLDAFVQLFEQWNKKINLSSARTREELEEHVLDSLHVVPHLAGAHRVLDVGSGGGFPVVVAAICLREIDFVALEPIHKKHAFLRTAARELELANLDARAIRIGDHCERGYDAAMSRATFDLREWILAGLDLVKPDGVAIGFEAIQRDDVPAPFQRHRYTLEGKARSIIVARRPH